MRIATSKPPIPVGTAKAEALGTYGPAIWANVFYYAVGTWDPAHLDDAVALIAAAVHDFYATLDMSQLAVGWNVTTTKVAFRDAADSLYRATVADAQSGADGSGDEAAQVAYLVNYTTNDDRKGGKPRTYVCGVPKDSMADSARLTNSVLTGTNTALTTWLGSLAARSHGTANGLSLLEMSFRSGNTWRDTAHTWPIRGVSLSPEVATQRRRVDRLRT